MPISDFRWLYLEVFRERWSPAGGEDVQWAYIQLLLLRGTEREVLGV